MSEQLGLDAIKASVLINVGTARVDLGDHDVGLELLERGTEAARAANVPFEIVRGLGNRASALWWIGRLDRPLALWRQALAESEQYGQTGFSRWFRGVGIGAEVESGEWQGALARAGAFIAEIEGGSPHYLASECYRGRALIRLGRGDEDGAVADAEESLDLARRATDPQARFPGQATAAHVFAELGDRDRAVETVADFLAAVESGQRLGYAVSMLYMLAWVVTETGAGPRLADALEHHYQTMWARAAAAYSRGDPVAAAEVLGAAGAVAPAAYCRLVAARRGDLEQLEPALAFYRSVGASRYVREGESLLGATTRSA